jgi:dinuclear metal center YbgI/SA1388 family protein
MTISEVIRAMELMAPPELAESWDNVGLLIGDAGASVRSVVLCIDVTEDVLAEAAKARAQLIIAHHPPIFKPIARVTAGAAPVVYAAARSGIAVYAAHTNLDSAVGGTNDALADAMGLGDRRPLQPSWREGQAKLVVFAQGENLMHVAEAAFAAGAGRIGNYSECAFFSHGIGSFRGGEGAHPAVGRSGRHEAAEEIRLEVVCPRAKLAAVLGAIRGVHSYEEPAIDVYPLLSLSAGAGNGRIGKLRQAATVQALVNRLKKATGGGKALLAAPRHGYRRADGMGKIVSTAACCAGSGGSAWRDALAAGATFFVTGEMNHHEALSAAAAGLAVLCVGHGNSERLVLVSLAKRLAAKLPKAKFALAARDHDPYEVV